MQEAWYQIPLSQGVVKRLMEKHPCYVVDQYQGQTVFVPYGCFHTVQNFQHTIKVRGVTMR